jgi:ElaB/YqjD/DUF883 family membrane-anchored ribosome-binding protein
MNFPSIQGTCSAAKTVIENTSKNVMTGLSKIREVAMPILQNIGAKILTAGKFTATKITAGAVVTKTALIAHPYIAAGFVAISAVALTAGLLIANNYNPFAGSTEKKS